MMRYLSRVLILAGAVLVSMAGMELGLRLIPARIWMPALSTGPNIFPWIRYDPITGHANRENFEHNALHINRFGLRGPDTTCSPDGKLRIVCMGDSRTFGIWKDGAGRRFDNSYPAYLQEILAGTAEVLNAGVIGYTSPNGLAQLHSQLLTLHPSIIVVSYAVNDHSPARAPELAPVEPPTGASLQHLFDISTRLELFRLAVAAYRRATTTSGNKVVNPALSLPKYERTLQRIVADARRNGIRVVFLTQALRPRSQQNVHMTDGELFLLGTPSLDRIYGLDADYQKAMLAVAHQLDVPVVDGAAAVDRWQGEPLFGPDDLVHVNPRGARLLAEVVRDRLADLGWLPTR